MLLFAFTLAAAMTMHDFWHIDDVAAHMSAYELFARDIAIAGGLLFIVGIGPGRFAIDNRGNVNGKPAAFVSWQNPDVRPTLVAAFWKQAELPL